MGFMGFITIMIYGLYGLHEHGGVRGEVRFPPPRS
jgi:hypothetical protein